jgi:hypothetical protein
VAGCYEYGDEPSGSGATKLVVSFNNVKLSTVHLVILSSICAKFSNCTCFC